MMVAIQLLLIIAGLVALPWLGVMIGGRPMIMGIALAEVAALIGSGWWTRSTDMQHCGGDGLCINEINGWYTNSSVLIVFLFLFAFIGASAFLAIDQNAKQRTRAA